MSLAGWRSFRVVQPPRFGCWFRWFGARRGRRPAPQCHRAADCKSVYRTRNIVYLKHWSSGIPEKDCLRTHRRTIPWESLEEFFLKVFQRIPLEKLERFCWIYGRYFVEKLEARFSSKILKHSEKLERFFLGWSQDSPSEDSRRFSQKLMKLLQEA